MDRHRHAKRIHLVLSGILSVTRGFHVAFTTWSTCMQVVHGRIQTTAQMHTRPTAISEVAKAPQEYLHLWRHLRLPFNDITLHLIDAKTLVCHPHALSRLT